MSQPNKHLVIRRILKADRQRVFSALSDPTKMAKWFYGLDAGEARVTCDFRVGGKYTIEMFNAEKKCIPTGHYLEIVPPERLVFTWSVDGVVQNSKVTIELFEKGPDTELVLTHELPKDVEERHQVGWINCLNHLETLLQNDDYQCEVHILAPASEVYKALTTAEGLKGWWTTTCEVRMEVGMRSKFSFGKTYNIMETERLEPKRAVEWRCIEQHHEAEGLNRSDEWAGTTLKFRLEPASPSSTTLRFKHEGLEPHLECYRICENGWNHFLKQSLKEYIETGRGEPFGGSNG